MKITKATLKQLIKEELDEMQGEPSEKYIAMAERVIERSKRFYSKLISACDPDILLRETAEYLAYTDQPGMGPNFRMGSEGVQEVPTFVFEKALRA